jgi:nucleotide-binding universal stress UspA family protein
MTALVSDPTMPVVADEPLRARPVALHRDLLLATDGSAAAFAATRFVGALAARWPVTPHVLTVVPPPPMAFDPVGANIAFGPSVDEQLRSEVQRQIDACAANAWSRETTMGAPASEIVRVSERRASDLIVLGLRPHAFLDRVFRDETALSVMRHARVPVIAVTPALDRLPRRIAVAIDFSRASIAAARSALTLLGDGGSLELVYVEPPAEPRSEETEGYGTIYAQGVAAAFSRLRQELASRTTTVEIETVVLHGNVAAELLSFADRANADLIALGSQRHSIARRAFVGGVTTALARSATRSLLVLPPGRRA